ncbi:MAG: hypothetical protein GX214_07255 [Clostridiales bacterium]|nr:hypothetical protein [Clostridiales bacterium]
MGRLINESSKFFICFLTGIITGILLGMIALTIVVSYRMDLQYKEITHLENLIEEKNSRLEKLEQFINTQELILKDIEIDLIYDNTVIDEIDKIYIEKTIKEKYTKLLGSEIKNINPNIIAEIVDKRIMKIDEREYKLKVEQLILTEILKLSILIDINDKI